jgi:hypothetical protein
LDNGGEYLGKEIIFFGPQILKPPKRNAKMAPKKHDYYFDQCPSSSFSNTFCKSGTIFFIR